METKPTVEDWLTAVKDAYADGCSDVEVCKVLNCTQRQFDDLYQKDPKFQELVDLGRTMAKAFWYEVARRNLTNRAFNSSVWSFVMKNRFGWSEKSENIDKSDIPLEQAGIDELEARLKKMIPSLAKKLRPDLADSEMLEAFSDRPN